MIKPERLRAGDRVAAISLSWGGAGVLPWRYEAGKKQLKEEFGLEIVETAHSLEKPAFLAEHPELRAKDLMDALRDPDIKGIISNIGGEDSIRMLPYLDFDVIRANPKVFVGFSDATVTHLAFFKAGVVSFYGPSLLAGFAENCGMFRYLADSFRAVAFDAKPVGLVEPNRDGWTNEFLDWFVPENATKDRRDRLQTSCLGWNWLQGGSAVVSGPLFGGCMEVLEFAKATDLWPDNWRGKILFFETSEDHPTPQDVKWWLRNYAAQGIFTQVAAVLFGRPGHGRLPVDPATFGDYDEAFLQVIAREEKLTDLPIVTGMDIGHTEPFMTLPIGVTAQLDCQAKTFSITEGAVL